MNRPRIAVICGGPSAYKSIQLLALEGYLCGIAIGTDEEEVSILLGKESTKMGLPFEWISKKSELIKLEKWLDETKPDAVFSMGFPFLVPKTILDKFPGKFINFHHGPLPSYRGATPIFEVLRAGEKETGVTVHLMEAEFDEGPIVFMEPIPIIYGETFGSLAVKMADRMSIAAQNVAQMLSFGSQLPAIPQSNDGAAYFPKPDPEDTLIRWPYMEAKEIVDLINACNPWNKGADTFLNQNPIKVVLASKVENEKTTAEPGTILTLEVNKPVYVACMNGEVIELEILSNEYGVFPGHFLLRQQIRVGHIFKQ